MINVVTAFHRVENYKWLRRHLMFHPIVWHKISDVEDFEADNTIFYEPIEGYDILYQKLNHFIRNTHIIDNAYYCFLNDDDAYEGDYFKDLPDADVIFTSMKRGYKRVGEHPIYDLIISSPDCVRVNYIGVEQFIVKGHVLKKIRFDTTKKNADGYMAVWLKNSFNCVYEPNRFVLFNYLQKGRWYDGKKEESKKVSKS